MAPFSFRGLRITGALDALVHETSHLELIARTAVDKVLVNATDSAPSPFRVRPRPLTRVLHATFVSRRIVHALEVCAGELPDAERNELAALRRSISERLAKGLRSLDQHARWTPIGAELFTSMQTATAQEA